jgi:hypothetical protein
MKEIPFGASLFDGFLLVLPAFFSLRLSLSSRHLVNLSRLYSNGRSEYKAGDVEPWVRDRRYDRSLV